MQALSKFQYEITNHTHLKYNKKR